MLSKRRRSKVLTCLATAALLIAVAVPAIAAPATDSSTPQTNQFFAWLARLGARLCFDLDRASAGNEISARVDPTEVDSPRPALDPDGSYTNHGGDEGEALPSMDPDG